MGCSRYRIACGASSMSLASVMLLLTAGCIPDIPFEQAKQLAQQPTVIQDPFAAIHAERMAIWREYRTKMDGLGQNVSTADAKATLSDLVRRMKDLVERSKQLPLIDTGIGLVRDDDVVKPYRGESHDIESELILKGFGNSTFYNDRAVQAELFPKVWELWMANRDCKSWFFSGQPAGPAVVDGRTNEVMVVDLRNIQRELAKPGPHGPGITFPELPPP